MTKLYISFTHALFAQGIQSLLRGQRGLRIVGMGNDEMKSLEAIETLQPEVVIVERAARGTGFASLAAIFQRLGAGRVVALSIDHNHATVYDRHAFTVTQHEDLLNAIRTARDTRESTPSLRGGLSRRSRAGTAREKSPGQTAQPRAKSGKGVSGNVETIGCTRDE